MVVVMLRRGTQRLRGPPGSGQPLERGRKHKAGGGRNEADGGHRGAKVGRAAELQSLLTEKMTQGPFFGAASDSVFSEPLAAPAWLGLYDRLFSSSLQIAAAARSG